MPSHAAMVRFGARRGEPQDSGEVEPGEAKLVARAQRDPQLFAPLYTRYVDPIYRYCYRRLGNRADAEDATSVIFVRALTSLRNYRDGSFRRWLFTIAHHVVTDSFRRVPPVQSLRAAEVLIDPDLGPDELAIVEQEHAAVRSLLSQLPAVQREVMELRLSGLRSAEVARILGRSPTAVRSLQFRAVNRLRALRDGMAAEEDGRRGSE